MNRSQLKIGLFGIGLEAYWKQFDGLKERLEGYLSEVHKRLCDIHEGIVNPGLIDTVEKAFEAGKKFRTEDVDLHFFIRHYLCFIINSFACGAKSKSGGFDKQMHRH
jgi:L-arabinose isomerase